MSETDRMRRFWDRRAREDAFHFVDNRLRYRDPDTAQFWNGGEADLDELLASADRVIPSGAEVLEIGCGVGRLTRVIAARAGAVRAVDVSAHMLELARRHNPELENVDWILGDGFSLSGVPDASVDACLSHVVFQHIPDPDVTLGYVREMGRVLRPGGWAVFQISNDPSRHLPASLGGWPARFRSRLLALIGRRPRGQSNPAWLGSAIELADLEHAASDGGLTIERIAGAGTQFCLVHAVRAGAGSSAA